MASPASEDAGRRQHRQIAGIQQQTQQIGVDGLDGAGPVVAQHHAPAVDAHAQLVLALALENAPIQTAETHGVDIRPLEFFDPHLVELAAVDHLEDLQRAPIRASAHIAALAGHKLGRMAQRLSDLVGGLGAAMHQQQFLARRPQRGNILNNGIDVQILAAPYFDDDHELLALFVVWWQGNGMWG